MQNDGLSAIETRYGGCRFRSRTEARWAVFFDALKVKWEYEPQAFALPSGAYLPDFYLPTIGAFFEVKAHGADDDPRWGELAERSVDDLYVVHGQPRLCTGDFDDDDIEKHFAGGGWDNQHAFCVCPWCGAVGIEFNGRGARVCGWKTHFTDEGSALDEIRPQGHWRADDKCYTFDDERIVLAVTAALSARFGAHE